MKHIIQKIAIGCAYLLAFGCLWPLTAGAQDPIPGYLSQISSDNLYAVDNDLSTLYGPRVMAYNSPLTNFTYFTSCTLNTAIQYPKANLDMAADYVQSRFESWGYTVTTEIVSSSAGHNVIATKVGSVYTNTFIDVTAHLDSVPNGPGACDNGSGVTAVVELARVLKDYHSRYSIRFITFVGEETGLQGAGYHVSQIVNSGEQIKADLNMDGIGWKQYSTNYNGIWQNGTWPSLMIADMFGVVRIEYGIDIGWGLVYPSGQTADNYVYSEYGFPAVLSIGGLPYANYGTHNCMDTMDTVDIPNVYKSAQQNLAVLVSLDQDILPPTWDQTDWSGGYGQDTWSDPTRFSSSSGLDYTAAGSVSLSRTSGGDVFFSDNFGRTNLAPWVVHNGTWNIQNGVLQALNPPSGDAIISMLTNASWTDYAVEAQVQIPVSSSCASVTARVNPTTGSRYSATLYPSSGPSSAAHVCLYSIPTWGGGATQLGYTYLQSVGTNWHALRLDCQGNRIRVYFDGALHIDATDTSCTAGGIGLETYTGSSTPPYSGAFQNVTVRTPAQYGGSGTLLSSAFDGGLGVQWQSISWDAGTNVSASLLIRTRTADQESGLAAAPWSGYYSASSPAITNPNQRWIQYEADMATTDPTTTPILNEVRINYTPALNSPPDVTLQPQNQTVSAGLAVSFSAAASGLPIPTVQWQVSTDGGQTWNDVTGATNTTLSFTTSLSDNGKQYQAVFSSTAGSAISAAATLTVNTKTTPVITWANPADIVYGTALGGTQLDASANVDGTFAYTPPAGTVLNAGPGQTLSVTFMPTDTTDYNSASATVQINVNKADQTISFGALSDQTYGVSPFTLGATASLGLAVSYSSSDPTVASVSGSTVTILKAGTTTITASQSGNANYNAALAVPQTLTVGKAMPVLTWSDPGSIQSGTPLGATQLNATANVPGTFVYNPPSGTVLSPGTNQPLAVTFTPTDATDYNTISATVHITVTVAGPVWTQTDWSGGAGQDVWSDATRFSSSSGVDFSTVGALQLSQTGGQGPFSDDFTRVPPPPLTTNSLDNNWSTNPSGYSGGQFTISGGILSAYNPSGFAFAYQTAPTITDGSVEADIRFPLGAYGGGISGRLTSATGTRYAIWVFPSSFGLYRFSSWGGSGTLGTMPIPGVGTGWHHVKLVLNGTSIQASWDGTNTITATDSTYASGTFSLEAGYAVGLQFNNYLVKDGAGNTVFSDDFGLDANSYDPMAPWTVENGSWTNDNGVLKAISGGWAVINMLTNSSWTDYSVQARVELPTNAYGAGVSGRVNPSTGSQYCVVLYSDTCSQTQLAHHLVLYNLSGWPGSYATTITSVDVQSVGTNWHTVKLDFLGTRIRVYYDDGLQINATDSSYSSGGIGLFTYTDTSIPCAGAFDNVVVSTPAQYGNSGTLLSSAFDGGAGVQWQTISWDASTSASATVLIRTRTADQESGLATAPWSDYYPAGGSAITSPNQRWIQYEVDLATTDLTATPVLNEVRINYAPALNSPPEVTLQPQNQTVSAGQPVSFSAAASGAPTPTAQWQVSTDGGQTWNDVTDATNTTLSFTTSPADNNKQYQAVFSNSAGSATSTAATLTVNNKVTPVITWANPADIVYGTALGGTQLDASANVDGTFAYTPPAGAVLNAGPGQTLSVTFTPTDTNAYNSASATVQINVDQAGQTISFGPLSDQTYGNSPFTLNATASSGLPVSYSSSDPTVVSVSGSTVTILKAGTATITATQTGNGNYNAALAVSQTLTVDKATPVITWSDPASIQSGTPLGAAQLNATANVPGTFVYNPPSGTVLSPGANQPLAATFTPSDTTDYNTISATVHITVIGTSLSWAQTDWSGGAGQNVWSNATQFASSSGIDFSNIVGSLQLTRTVGQTLFSDDFTRVPPPPLTTNALDNNWSTNPASYTGGRFSVAGGILSAYYNGGSYAFAYQAAPTITNGSVEADVLYPSGSSGGGISGRLSSSSGARYLLYIQPYAFYIYRESAWAAGASLGSMSIPGVVGSWHHFKLVLNGTTIQAIEDGTNTITATDSTYASGTFGLEAYGTVGLQFNNYVVKDGAGNMVFSDDFGPDASSYNPLAPWTVENGSWTNDNGVLKALGGGFVVINMLTNSSWTDYSVQAQVELATNGYGACVSGRVNASNGSQYSATLYSDTCSQTQLAHHLVLYKLPGWPGSTATTITSVDVQSVGTNWHTVKLDFLGTRIRVYYDSGLQIDATDSSYSSGGIGLFTYTDTSIPFAGAFDNVVVSTDAQYSGTGTLLSSAFDGGAGVQWQTISWNAVTGTATTVRMRTRTADQAAQLVSAVWSDYYTTSGSQITSANKEWIQCEVDLATSDPSQTPVLNDVTVSYTPGVAPSSTALISSANPALPATPVTFTATVTGTGTPTGTVQFKNNGTLFDTETLTSGSATSAPISTLPHGNNAITAEYPGDANFLSSTGSLNEVIDTPPKSATHFFGTPMNTSLSITTSTLTNLDYDADGDALTFANVSSTSSNGPAGNVTFTGGTFTYAPMTGYVGADLFTYAVSDGYPGGTVTNSVVVTVRLANGVTSVFNSISAPSGQSITLRGYGIPGNSYEIQKSDDMVTWTTIGTANALPNGLILFTDTHATGSQAYYRLATP